MDIVSYLMGKASGGGGGGGDTTEAIDLDMTGSVASAYYGKIIVSGKKATLQCYVRSSSAFSSWALIGTVPAGYRPAGAYPFVVGNGGTANQGYGLLSPTGEIRINYTQQSYAFFSVSWGIAKQSVAVQHSTALASVTGGIGINGNYAEMSIITRTSPSLSYNWYNDVIVIPDSIRPAYEVIPFLCVDNTGHSYGVRDTSYSNGAINAYLQTPDSNKDLYWLACWSF